jgi:hypothetical protein
VPEQLVPTLVILAVIALAFAGMAIGWRRRVRRQSALGPVAVLPADPGTPALTAEVLYVATTLRDQPLERVAVAGLGLRARATAQVFAGGLSLALAGRDAAWIPAADLDGVDRSTYAIDRGVEPGGLLRISWDLGGTPVDTFLRPPSGEDATALLDAIQRILRGSVASSPDTSERGI